MFYALASTRSNHFHKLGFKNQTNKEILEKVEKYTTSSGYLHKTERMLFRVKKQELLIKRSYVAHALDDGLQIITENL